MTISSLAKVSGSLLLISALVACSPDSTAPSKENNTASASVQQAQEAPKVDSNTQEAPKVDSNTQEATKKVTEQKTDTEKVVSANLAGFYVDEDYKNRKHGTDWTGFRITKQKDGLYKVHVEGRVTSKGSTCSGTFTGGKAVNEHTLKVPTTAGELIFTIKDKHLSVEAKEMSTLYYFCRGGGSLRGDYTLTK